MALTSGQKAAIRYYAAKQNGYPVAKDEDEFAATIGVTRRTLLNWRKENEEFIRDLERAVEQFATSADYHAVCVRQNALDEIDKKMQQSTDGKAYTESDKRQYIKMALDMTAHVDDSGDTVSRAHVSDAELVAEILDRKVSVFGVTETELRETAEKLSAPKKRVAKPRKPTVESASGG
jgi:hypothetical protein